MTPEAAIHNEHSKRNKLLKVTDPNLRFSQAGYEEFYLHILGYNAIVSSVRQITFWRVASVFRVEEQSSTRFLLQGGMNLEYGCDIFRKAC
jgi:hypothetical protein